MLGVITLNKFEQLEQEAHDDNVKIHNYYLGEENLKGIYINGHVAINTSVKNSAEKSCVLAEELGHHYTTVGNILDMNDLENCKQEYKARFWAYNKQIGLDGLIDAYEHGCRSAHEIAAYLEVTDKFLIDCVEAYRSKYGEMISSGKYTVCFIPHLMIMKKV